MPSRASPKKYFVRNNYNYNYNYKYNYKYNCKFNCNHSHQRPSNQNHTSLGRTANNSSQNYRYMRPRNDSRLLDENKRGVIGWDGMGWDAVLHAKLWIRGASIRFRSIPFLRTG
mmetsp:Transcript_3002/g.7198  ORF Transcript_3002/g.7198 Transcript_3002/m.7198 type:complete len:114 (-) Transcript_3002:3551-3892(-)